VASRGQRPSIIQEAQKAGATTLRQIAEALNARGVATARGGSGTQCQTATCSAEPEEHATMLVTLGTLVAGLAVVAVAFEAPMAALALGAAAFWLFAHSV